MAPQDAHPIGAPVELGRFTFTAEEIVRFARLYDPQPFHVDMKAAERSAYGTLIASGWHTVATWMGFFVRAHGPLRAAPDEAAADRPEIISPVGVGFGLKELEWRLPVRAGEEIVFSTVLEHRRASASRPGWAIYGRRALAHRVDGVCVMRFVLNHLAPEAATLTGRAGRSDPSSPAP